MLDNHTFQRQTEISQLIPLLFKAQIVYPLSRNTQASCFRYTLSEHPVTPGFKITIGL